MSRHTTRIVLLVLSWVLVIAEKAAHDELVLVPDANGNLYKINVTQREMQYARAYKRNRNIDYYVLTRQYPIGGIRFKVGDVESLRQTNFKPANPTRILVHGWRSNRYAPINTDVASAYLNMGEYNVIVVDWTDDVGTIDYFAARKRVTSAGRKVAKMIDFLHMYGGLNLRKTYLIGHSLGAHMCGVASRYVNYGSVEVIVALDAALPLFKTNSPDGLMASDANYVLSIHTNGGKLGIHTPIGHASFYPNWGKKQAGCGADSMGNCSHQRAVELFVESLTDGRNNFLSQMCSGYYEISIKKCTGYGETAYMGGDPINTDYRGEFYLRTNSRKPFGMGRF